jgi:CheY-like chemotaxis protein
METILILEDIENVRAVFASVLRREGYSVLEAITIDEALDHQKKHAGQLIPLVIANVILSSCRDEHRVRKPHLSYGKNSPT